MPSSPVKSINLGLYVARLIHTNLAVANASAWQWWTAVSLNEDVPIWLLPLDGLSGESVKNDGRVVTTKMFWATANYSFFIRPGMRRIDVRASGKEVSPLEDATSLMLSSYTDGTQVVTVIVNYADKDCNISLKCGAARKGKTYVTSIDKDFKLPLKLYYKSCITSVANYYCACGEEAGKFLFPGKEYAVIPNAIETDKFRYDKEIRDRKRKELGINNEMVLGHVGRISYQKNHKFLIEIFYEILKKNNNALLLLVGIGEKEEEVKKQIVELGISNKVRFLGNRADVFELYQAMDAFVLPSFFEGIPVVGIEAQYAGLPCFFSDKVPKEVAFSDNCSFIGLSKSVVQWENEILKTMQKCKRDGNDEKLRGSLYDIKNAYKILADYYYSFVEMTGN